MKRSDELAPLSRDHHQALFVAMKLKRAEADGAEAFLGFIAAHGGDHFRIEEEILLPAWIASDPEPTALSPSGSPPSISGFAQPHANCASATSTRCGFGPSASCSNATCDSRSASSFR